MQMPISMDARKELSEQLLRRYRKAKKKERGKLLDYTVEVTGWCRKHAAAVLSGKAPVPRSAKKGKNNKKTGRRAGSRGRRPKYGVAHKAVLKKVWAVLDFSGSVRVKAGMKDVLGSMERCKTKWGRFMRPHFVLVHLWLVLIMLFDDFLCVQSCAKQGISYTYRLDGYFQSMGHR
ncbi:MAG: hypothetical protein LBP24_00675 [Coriobacteriales bacterium]|jgi:hypothetical protein|nr:hypothetical protein [Coriobacteriales bacterium]